MELWTFFPSGLIPRKIPPWRRVVMERYQRNMKVLESVTEVFVGIKNVANCKRIVRIFEVDELGMIPLVVIR
jgi:hypothetical protein